MIYKTIKTSTDDLNVIESITKEILSKKLSPCVSFTKNCNSSYIWKNKIENSNEFILSIKTIDSNVEEIKQIIKDCHNYSIPEIISIEFEILNKEYKKWFNKSISI